MDTLSFVGRGWETLALGRFYEEREAAILILYGRKGVGKTRLLREFITSEQIQDVLYWTAPSGAYAEQLQSFSQALYDFGQTPLPSPDFCFYNWEGALAFMADFIEQSQDRLSIKCICSRCLTSPCWICGRITPGSRGCSFTP